MTRTFLNGFVHYNEDDAFYLEDEVYITTLGDIKGFGEILSHVGHMDFSDGSCAEVWWNHTNSKYYIVEFANEDEWDKAMSAH